MRLLSLHAVVFLFALLTVVAPVVQAAPIPLPGHENDDGKKKKHGALGAVLGAAAAYGAYRKAVPKENRSFFKTAAAVVGGGVAGKAIGDHLNGIKNFFTGKKDKKQGEGGNRRNEGEGSKKKEKKHGALGAMLGAVAGYGAYRKAVPKENRSFMKAAGAVVAGGVAGKVAGDHWSGIKNFLTGKKSRSSEGGEGEKKHGGLGAMLGAATGFGAYNKLVPKENRSFLKAAGAVMGGGIAGKSIGDHWSSIKGFFGGSKKDSGKQDGGYQRDQYQQNEYKRERGGGYEERGGGYENNGYGEQRQRNRDYDEDY
ncbi:hypothetical protein HK405_015597 [Cladochytrium tenue]|nr:hypothetical protein HK405_015597 [Cladochytrium tenue]